MSRSKPKPVSQAVEIPVSKHVSVSIEGADNVRAWQAAAAKRAALHPSLEKPGPDALQQQLPAAWCKVLDDLDSQPREPLIKATTAAELRAFCEQWRANLDDAALSFSPEYVAESWAIMRRLSNEAALDVPPEPYIGDVSEFQAAGLQGQSIPVDGLMLRNTIDAIIAWCRNAESGVSTDTAPVVNTALVGKGVAPRNTWIVQQYEAAGTETYHKPAKIHAAWCAMTTTARAAVCPDSPNKISKSTVAAVIKLANKVRTKA